MRHDTSRSIRRGCSAALACNILAASPPALADYPIASHRYLADPGSLVHGGRVYLYASNDDDNPVEGGYQMKSLVCVSSGDLKNWTDHGEVLRVPANAAWANDSWAPAAVERNGSIYLYFGNNAGGIGVASSQAPIGPFNDPIGAALVSFGTPGASGTDMWLFDPSVFIDDDGQAYLTFGGNADNNARIILLNSDMVSVSGSAIALTLPSFFEASWLHKQGGLYYLSYSTTPAAGQRIDYLTSSSPTSGFTYRGIVGDQPPSNANNNHHSIFEFQGTWYHAYHNRIVATQAAIPTTYRRNLALEPLAYNADGSIQQVTYTVDGVPQLASLNPYTRVEAETMNAQSGIETEPCSEGGMDVTDIQAGDWVKLRSVDFGSTGAASFSASVASATSGGAIELRLDSPDGLPVGTCTVPGTGGAQAWVVSTCSVSGAMGVHDLYLAFTGDGSPLFNVDYWQFEAIGGAVDAGGGAMGNGGGGASGLFGVGGSGDTVGSGGVISTGGGVAVAGSAGASSATEPGGSMIAARRAADAEGCSCVAAPRSKSPTAPAAILLAAFVALCSRRRTAQSS
jgi:arabinoxylan arabinofuranohydrolase